MPIPEHRKLVSFVAAAVALFVGLTPQARADSDHQDQCREIVGPFSSVTVPVPPCNSPVGLCTHGILGGPMDDAAYDFTVYTLTPSPTNPAVIVATGKSVITTKKGQMFTDDVSVLNFSGPAPSDPVAFVTTATINSGTKHWKQTTGQFVATGVLVQSTGLAVGNYTASLCKNSDEQDNKDCSDN